MRRGTFLLVLLMGIFLSTAPLTSLADDQTGGPPYVGGPPPGGSVAAFVQQLQSKSHPYLFFNVSQLEALRQRRTQPPYDGFYRQIKSYADDVLKIGVRKAGVGITSGWITDRAVRTALVYYLEEDEKYMQAMETFIASITSDEIDAILEDYQTVHTVLHHYAALYDLTAPHLTATSRQKLESMLERMVERYIENFDSWNVRSYGRFPTNHGTRGEAGVCLAAMANPQHAQAVAWLDRCLSQLHFQFSYIGGHEGIWIEGPSYFHYGIDPFFDFGLAYYHLSGVNVFASEDPPIHAIFDSMIKIRRPDGYGPQFNDASTRHVNQTTIAWMFPDAEYHHWSQEFLADDPDALDARSLNTVMDFLFYQPVESVEPPWGETLFFPEDQVAVMREDFSPASSYVFLRGFDLEFCNHGQYDQGNFQFWAFQTPLIVDGGYNGWEDSRNAYLTDLVYPDGHNLVLVDGTGPYKRNPGLSDRFYLRRYATTSFLDTADLEGTYDQTGSMPDGWKSDCQDIITGVDCDAERPRDNVTDISVDRTFYYLKGTADDPEYLAVIDTVQSTQDPPDQHDYSLLLHGPSTDFIRQGEIYTWTTANHEGDTISLAGLTTASGPITYATKIWYHFYPTTNDRKSHTRLELKVPHSSEVAYVTLLYPYQQGMTTPILSTISGDGGSIGVKLTVGSVADRVVFNPQGSQISIDGIDTDARSVWTRHRTGELVAAALKGGASLTVDDHVLVDLTQALDYVIGTIDLGTGAYQILASSGSGTFVDVPFEHWAHDSIEALYREGYTAGCGTDPLRYCPDQAMIRAESAVFVERGVRGVDYQPSLPNASSFEDVPSGHWGEGWIESLWEDGYTAGCGTDPLVYCPLQEHTRAEGCVFYLRMLHGADYEPPAAQGVFVDVPVGWWGSGWVEAGYEAGLIEPCEVEPELRFCPNEPLTRALAATMMVQAKGLSAP